MCTAKPTYISKENMLLLSLPECLLFIKEDW